MTRARDLADYISTGVSDTELDVLDGVTAGTVTASKALVVDANKDIASLRNATLAGTATINTLAVDGGTIKLDGNYPVGTENVALGNTALDDGSLSGGYNTAVGSGSLSANTSGQQNASFGAFSLDANTTGSYNAGFGQSSLGSNTTGSYNTGLGRGTLSANTTAEASTAVGYQSLNSNTGQHNTAVGYRTLYSNTTGTPNTAIGYEALDANTTGSRNTGLGVGALGANTTADDNTAVGYASLLFNTTGHSNTAIGKDAGYALTTGLRNTLVGHNAGLALATSNSDNVFVGQGAGSAITTGDANVIIGRYSGNAGGLDIRTSSNNIVLSDGDGTPRVHVDSSGRVITKGSPYVNHISQSGSGTITLDTAAYGSFIVAPSGNITLVFSNALHAYGSGFILKISPSATVTITYPTSVDWAGGTAPDAPANGEHDYYVFISYDGGLNWFGFQAGDAMA